MSTYLQNIFTEKIKKDDIKTIFEIGSRDLLDGINLIDHYDSSKLFAFECNPEGLVECYVNLQKLPENKKDRIKLVEKAVYTTDSKVKFYPFDITKYNNIGASSIYKIDFSNRPPHEGDIFFGKFPPGFVQKEIEVDGIRLDTFCSENNINFIDLVCMDLQGSELQALKSAGSFISNIKYIITESSYVSTYVGGATFEELNNFLTENGFDFVCSDKTGMELPSEKFFSKYTGGTSEFNALFINKNI